MERISFSKKQEKLSLRTCRGKSFFAYEIVI